MNSEEIKNYFKNEVYQAHPEYEIELLALNGSSNIYLIVHLDNSYCYCFLLFACTSKDEYDNRKPSANILNDFMQSSLFKACVLKKVCLIYEPEKGAFEHKTFAPENT